MKKFINILIVINGLIIPIFIIVLLYKYYSESTNYGIDYEQTGIIVGDKLDKAKADSLALQGLSYDSPFEIYNSTNFYMPLFAKTFEEARELTRDSQSAGDIYLGALNYVNILFLDKDYGVIGTLLDKKASIIEITLPTRNYYRDSPIDTTIKNIAYMISYSDSNKDGVLDYSDNHDLYISDLSGKSLTKVTEDKDVLDYEFIKSNTEIFIRYLDRSDLRDEYKKTKFGLFRIATGEFKELKEIEKSVNEIEYSLIN